MVNASKALAWINNRQGIYYVYGNHDNGSHAFSDSDSYEDVRATLEKNGIVVLEDAVVSLRQYKYYWSKRCKFLGYKSSFVN